MPGIPANGFCIIGKLAKPATAVGLAPEPFCPAAPYDPPTAPPLAAA
jgi:hypothetical protein